MIEGRNEMVQPGGIDPSMMALVIREDGQEIRPGSENGEGASGDNQDATGTNQRRRIKKYQRHTPYQIQELEAYFKDDHHPDEKQRLELGSRLGLESNKVKFWFQNRRSQVKTQAGRQENNYLKRQNEALQMENLRLNNALRNSICVNCGCPTPPDDVPIEELHLRSENARLRDELTQLHLQANKFLGNPTSSSVGPFPLPLPNSSLELAVGRTGFDVLSSPDTTFSLGLDSGSGNLNAFPAMPVVSTTRMVGMAGTDIPDEKSILAELALNAMDELDKLVQIDDPLWVSADGQKEVLNQQEYRRICPPCFGTKLSGFVTEATRATGTVIINSSALVNILMDVNQWVDMFPCMIGRASTLDMIFSGAAASRNCDIQLMEAEFQALSPLVPVRHMRFLRFCKKHAEGVWAVVDVSVDSIQEVRDGNPFMPCRRLPSGCFVQDMSNGFSKVTWVEHTEYDENVVHQLYRPLLSSGQGFGAQRWLAMLQRQSQRLANLVSPTISTEGHQGVTPAGRRSVVKLAQRMTRSFCSGVCATVHLWQLVEGGNVGEDTRILIRTSTDNPGKPSGLVLSATTSVWMPLPHQHVFNYLRDEQMRGNWDELSNGRLAQQTVFIAEGQDHGNCVSLLRATHENATLMLQETQTDASGSIVVYAAVDIAAMQLVMSRGDSSSVALLPSGFAVVPYYKHGNSTDNLVPVEGGSLLTVGFQILVDRHPPTAKISMESVDSVKGLLLRTVQRIKAALHCY
ncbi:homeobox-leucine zipper protein ANTHOCYANINLESS 2-like [Diospyros lotus]|uniref:homeobox-leucine zipper protein ANTHOCYANINLESS 2-like n=1 Tax=Diospyros lotus TaxID=55363 RepID=UPI0022518BFA|nr:homeobox-leucine zipper protein ANTHOCYANINLESS 2-like [Diospyros lotus]